MFDYLTQPVWSPYITGAGIGILVCLSFLLADRPLGCSSAFVKARGLLERTFNAEGEKKNEYYQQMQPNIDWSFMIIPGVIIGAFVSSVLSGSFTWSGSRQCGETPSGTMRQSGGSGR